MRGLIDDRRHPQLSRGRCPAQTRIDALDRGVGPKALGECQVMEVEAQSGLNDFTMGGYVSGVAWSVNPYVGCIHDCGYCFVPQTLHVERRRWGQYVLAKANLPSLLREELKVEEPKTVYVSTATDPYQSIEAQHHVTRNCLAVLARHDWPVDILTRSPLVTRDIPLLRRFTRLRVGLSVPTLDDAARQAMEPAAPPIRARLNALRELADAGLVTYANYAPAYPPTSGWTMKDLANAYAAAGVQWVNTSYWKYQGGWLGPVWDRFHDTQWDDMARFMGDAERQRHARRRFEVEMDRVGIPVRTGFFNEPFEEEDASTSKVPLDRFYGPPTFAGPN